MSGMISSDPKGNPAVRVISVILVCLFLTNAPASAGQCRSSTLSPESRLRPFLDKHGLDFRDSFALMCAVGELIDLIDSGTLREGNVARINTLNEKWFPGGEIEITTRIRTRTLSSGKKYHSAIFNFKNKQFEARFIGKNDDLTGGELEELGVQTEDDKSYFSSLRHTALSRVWFVGPGTAPDGIIGGLIEEGSMVELAYEGRELKAYTVNYPNGHAPGVTDPAVYRGAPVAVSLVLNEAESAKFQDFILSNLVNGEPVRFRVAMGSSALGWNDMEYSDISRAGRRDGVVYIGRELLKRMFQEGNEILRDEILLKYEFRHLAGKVPAPEERRNDISELVNAALENTDMRSGTEEVSMPSLSGLSLKGLIERAPEVDDYCAANPGRCDRLEHPAGIYRGRTDYYFKGAADLTKYDEHDRYKILLNGVIYGPDGKQEGTVFVYYHIREDQDHPEKEDNSITFVVKSSDQGQPVVPNGDKLRGEEGWDKAVIKVYLDGARDRVSLIDYKVKPLSMSLSRTALGILLDDAKLEGELLQIYGLLKKYFVIPEITDAVRISEKRDNIPVPLAAISRANSRPAEISEGDISVIEGFADYKSWSIRELAINAIRRLYEAGRISASRYESLRFTFETLSIREDRRFIERYLIERPGLIEKLIKEVSGHAYKREDVSSISVKWLGRGKNKSVYRIWFKTNDGRVFVTAVSTIRHNPWNFSFDGESIKRSVGNWMRLSDKGHPSVPRILAYEWALDFRPRMTDRAFDSANPEVINDEVWVRNDICMVFRSFLEGDDLSWILENPSITPEDKALYKQAALQAALDIWNDTKDESGKGLFIGDPKPANIAVNKKGGIHKAQVIDLDVLRDFDDFNGVLAAIRSYPEYDDVDILYDNGRARAVYAEDKAGKPLFSEMDMNAAALANDLNRANVKMALRIPENALVFHVISEEIIPSGQVNMVKGLEVKMRGDKYPEKVLFMPAVKGESPEAFIARLEIMRTDAADRYKGYKIVFNVACRGTETVRAAQDNRMGALAFGRAGGDIVQVEGIILALRALGRGDAEGLIGAYELVTGEHWEGGAADIFELARKMVFTLPSARAKGNALKRINDLIEKNILNAA